jgi:hypothetical protein
MRQHNDQFQRSAFQTILLQWEQNNTQSTPVYSSRHHRSLPLKPLPHSDHPYILSLRPCMPSNCLPPHRSHFSSRINLSVSMQTGHVIGKGQPPSFDYKKYTDVAVKGPADPVHPLTGAVTETVTAKPVHTFTIDEDF